MKKRSQQELSTERDVCLAHAEEVVGAAKLLLGAGLHHLAYHMATLSLEETGKGEMLAMASLGEEGEEDFGPGGLDDHVRKLFFSLWGPSFGKELVTKESLETYERLATNIHERRLGAIYYSPGSSLSPRHAVTVGEAKTLVSMAEARVGMARTYRLRDDLDEEEKKDIRWYSRITRSPETRREILSRESMTKLVEIGSSSAWIRWLREQYEGAEAQAAAELKAELARTRPEGEEAKKPKWRVRIHLETNSHSIRPSVLTWWNGLVFPIRLYPRGTRKRELTLEFTLPSAIPIGAVWSAGWDMARQVAFALNVGTLGYFWWYVPRHVSKYHESITDLERNVEVNVERSPALQFEDRRVALTKEDLTRTSIVLATLWRQQPDVAARYVGPYLRGITLLSKNDVHLQFEPNAFLDFFAAFTAAREVFTGRDASSVAAFSDAVRDVLPAFDEADRLFALAEALRKTPDQPSTITLDEVGKMKTLCDALVVMEYRRQAAEWRQAQRSGERPKTSPLSS